jgi:hypothetical protein
MLAETGPQRFSLDTLTQHVIDVLISLENRVDLFQNLLCSYPNRIKAVKEANGKHTHY